jgi:predicted DsbA family dithiol-disulfide isomerase
MEVAPRSIVVYSDIGCPWAHVAVFRLHRMRAKLGLEDEVHIEARSYPLEVINEQPTPKKVLDAEISVAGGLEPDAGWQIWQRPDFEFPVTTLPALEAVQAAREQSERASELLDRALRVALFGKSEVVSMRHTILEVAQRCDGIDADALGEALDDGRARSIVMDQANEAEDGDISGSPHIFLSDGSEYFNPGVELSWEGEHGKGFPIIQSDDPEIYEEILTRAAS